MGVRDWLQSLFATVPQNATWLRVDRAQGVPRWELVDLIYQNEQQSGGNHNIYITVLDENNAPLSGVKVWQAWPDGKAPGYTRAGVYDFPMSGDGYFFPDRGESGPYSCHVEGSSDVVRGMGLPAKRHVNYIATYKRVVQVAPPLIPPEPPTEPPSDWDAHARVIAREEIAKMLQASLDSFK